MKNTVGLLSFNPPMQSRNHDGEGFLALIHHPKKPFTLLRKLEKYQVALNSMDDIRNDVTIGKMAVLVWGQ